VVVKSVPDHPSVVGIPGRIVRSRLDNAEVLEHAKLPDPEGQAIEQLAQRVEQLESIVRELCAKLSQSGGGSGAASA